jgi:hypothetical protein
MQSYLQNIDGLLFDPNLKVLYDLGFIDEIAVRNHIINSEFKQLRKTHSQIEAIFLLSQKYHLAFGTINSIIFRRRSRKSLHLDKLLKGLNQSETSI